MQLKISSRPLDGREVIVCELAAGRFSDSLPNSIYYHPAARPENGIQITHRPKQNNGKSRGGVIRIVIDGDTSMRLLSELFGRKLANRLAMRYRERTSLTLAVPTALRDHFVKKVNTDALRALGVAT